MNRSQAQMPAQVGGNAGPEGLGGRRIGHLSTWLAMGLIFGISYAQLPLYSSTTVNQIAQLINEITGNKAGIKHTKMRPGEPERSIVLGNPETLKPLAMSAADLLPLEQGMERTVRWYRDHYELESSASPEKYSSVPVGLRAERAGMVKL